MTRLTKQEKINKLAKDLHEFLELSQVDELIQINGEFISNSGLMPEVNPNPKEPLEALEVAIKKVLPEAKERNLLESYMASEKTVVIKNLLKELVLEYQRQRSKFDVDAILGNFKDTSEEGISEAEFTDVEK